jgi:ATP-dependent 26S proteasome regulatory subunit
VVYRGGGDLTVHAGLELFQFSKDVNNSNDVLYDEQILSIRESTENFIQQLWKDFDTYQRENGLLKNSKFDAMITQLNPKGRTFDDMIISDSKKKLLDENIFAILSNSERLIERGVETNRGIMLAGPPGVGKSLTIDAVISKADCTVVFTNFLMLRKNMEWIFELSRRYAPTVLILEDIDALGITGQRGEGGTGAGLSTLLNCMDGINSNNGVISVATSNHPEQMDWALIARPGRFDVRIDYPYPDKDVLRSIMELKLSSYQTVDDLDLDALVKTMPLGFTGSHIHDIVNQANYISINNSKAAAKKVKITQESLASATERTLYNFNKFLDERPHIQLQNPPSVQEVLKGTKGKKENYHQ